MNAVFPALFAVVTLASTSCQQKEQAAVQTPPALSVSAIDIDEEASSLKGDVHFSIANLNAALRNWQEVDPSEFYYEAGDPSKCSYPFLEGTYQAENSQAGTWRYYMCAGLKICEGEQGSYKFYMPVGERLAKDSRTN